jgi:hypothetical protein
MKNTILLGLGPGVQQDLLHLFARERVERAHGFVHEQHGRVAGQRARNAHPLLHATGKLVHGAVGVLLEADEA